MSGHSPSPATGTGCKRPVGHIHVVPCHATKDACGGDLIGLKGAWVELKPPGCDAPIRLKEITLPDGSKAPYIPITADYGVVEVNQDGDYLIRTVSTTGCVDSSPSDWTAYGVDLTPPDKPPAPKVIIPCPQDTHP